MSAVPSMPDEETQHLLQFLYMSPVGLISFRDDGTIERINPAAINLVVSAAHLVDHRNVFGMFGEIWPELRDLVGYNAGKVGSMAGEHRFRSFPSRPEQWLSFNAVCVGPDSNMLTVADVTSVVVAERRLSESLATERLTREHLDFLQRTSVRIASARDVEDISRLALDDLLDTFGFSEAAISVREGVTLRTMGTSSAGERSPTLYLDSHAPGAQAVTLNETIVLLGSDEIHRRFPNVKVDQIALDALIAIPLKAADGNTLGSLVVGSPVAQALGGSMMSLLQGVAHQVGQALERAQLAGRLVDLASREEVVAAWLGMERAVVESADRFGRLGMVIRALTGNVSAPEIADIVLNQGMSGMGATGAILGLVESGSFLVLAAVGEAKEIVGHLGTRWGLDRELPVCLAIRQQEAMWVTDHIERSRRFPELLPGAPSGEALIAVPLIVDGEALGAIGLTFSDARAFAAEERLYIGALAAAAAQALSRVTLLETQRRAQMEAVATPIRLLHTLNSEPPDGIVAVNSGGIMTVVNHRLCQIFGYSPEEMTGKPLSLLLPDEVRGTHQEAEKKYAAEPGPRPMMNGLDLRGLRSDGTEVEVDISLSPCAGPNGLLVVALVREKANSSIKNIVPDSPRASESAELVALARDLLVHLEASPDDDVSLRTFLETVKSLRWSFQFHGYPATARLLSRIEAAVQDAIEIGSTVDHQLVSALGPIMGRIPEVVQAIDDTWAIHEELALSLDSVVRRQTDR